MLYDYYKENLINLSKHRRLKLKTLQGLVSSFMVTHSDLLCLLLSRKLMAET